MHNPALDDVENTFTPFTAEQRSEIDSYKAATEAALAETAKLKAAIASRDFGDALRDLTAGEEFVSPKARESAQKLLKEQLALETDQLTVVSADGAPVMGRHGILTPQELLKNFKAENPNFFRAANTTATTGPSQGSTSRAVLENLFGGREWNPAVHKIAKEDPAQYRRLLAAARSEGITR